MPRSPEETLNLVQIFLNRADRYSSRQALLYKDPIKKSYQPISWEAWKKSVRNTALGLYALGVRKGDRVGILSENRPEWTYADLGALSLGAIDVPIYPTSSEQDVSFILQNAGLETLFVSTPTQFERIRAVSDQSASLRSVILIEGNVSHKKILLLEELLKKGEAGYSKQPKLYDERVTQVRPEDLATLIYTSGTTGPPKGVMLTHSNFIANCVGSREHIPTSDKDLALSFLPLSHVFERMAGYYFMIFHGATIAYAETILTVPEDIVLVRPTIAAAVPRFYEKVYAKILEKVEAASPTQQKIFRWALGVGKEVGKKRQGKEPLSFGLAVKNFFAHLLVIKKIKARLGGRIRCFISGSAPLSKELAEFFFAADVLILEGYGLTETSPVIAVNKFDFYKFGTVGPPLPNVQVKIAEDGEILTKGPCVMKGYYQNEAATREAIKDGWFYTGDIGELDAEGFLKITDRKKDVIKTSGGKMVAPQNIENLLQGDKLFTQVIVVGDKRNYLVALIVPNKLEIENFAKHKNLESSDWKKLLANPEVYTFVERRLREKTAALAPFEQIKYFALLPQEFTIAAGECTPTFKIKRRVVQEKFKDIIEALYQKGGTHQKVVT